MSEPHLRRREDVNVVLGQQSGTPLIVAADRPVITAPDGRVSALARHRSSCVMWRDESV
jgi:hypothetical protein